MIFREISSLQQTSFLFLGRKGGGKKMPKKLFLTEFGCKIQTLIPILKNNDLLGKSPHFGKTHYFFLVETVGKYS